MGIASNRSRQKYPSSHQDRRGGEEAAGSKQVDPHHESAAHQRRTEGRLNLDQHQEVAIPISRKTEANKKHSIQNFARGLVELGENLVEIKNLQKE